MIITLDEGKQVFGTVANLPLSVGFSLMYFLESKLRNSENKEIELTEVEIQEFFTLLGTLPSNPGANIYIYFNDKYNAGKSEVEDGESDDGELPA